MKMAVTGALGHIGSRLIHDLRPSDVDEAVLIDDFSTQRYPSLFNLPDGVPYRLVEADILTADLERCLDGADVVIHLAAITNAEGSFDIQERVEDVNYTGTEKVARACAAVGAKLVFLSTTSVYGTQQEVVDEACHIDSLQPQSPYAKSKLKAELLLQHLSETIGLKFIIFRFGTIYGVSPGMRFHTAVNKFVWNACAGKPLTIWRTALRQRRPYLDVKDGVRALKFAIERHLFDGNVYNVLTNNHTVSEVVEEIRKLVPDLSVEFVESRIMNQLSYTVSTDRLAKLGFIYEGDLSAALGETVALLRNIRATAP